MFNELGLFNLNARIIRISWSRPNLRRYISVYTFSQWCSPREQALASKILEDKYLCPSLVLALASMVQGFAVMGTFSYSSY